ncbi:Wzz/FepE/Etk N-terminal domain-containing protein [Kitasatospora sp. NPDC096140]|uniref:Wzz/FepE/Etk N-terminal domain-containing protein n=1 Tax=Kitasatospora sp. NPDC096140 TaxID=3155425 RepID=UPI00332A5DB1
MTTPRRSARRLVRRWWPVALAVPLGAAAGAGYAVVSPPSYATNAYVLVVPQNPGEAATATNFAQAYGRLAGQPQVLAVAAAETGRTRAELEELVHGTTSPDAPMIEITGTGTRAQDAARTADAVARSLVSFANTSSKDTNVRLVTLAPAAAPDKPTTPSGKLDVAVGGAAGLLLGALVMMTRRRDGAAAPDTAEGAEGAVPAGVPTPPRPRTGERPVEAAPGAKADAAGAGPAAADAKAGPKADTKADTKAGGTTAAADAGPAATPEPAAGELVGEPAEAPAGAPAAKKTAARKTAVKATAAKPTAAKEKTPAGSAR